MSMLNNKFSAILKKWRTKVKPKLLITGKNKAKFHNLIYNFHVHPIVSLLM